VGFAVGERQAYRWAIEADARARGIGNQSPRFAAHWPLEVFDSVLASVADPERAESLVHGADTVRYYLVPVSGTNDTALVQEFRFRFALRVNSVVVDYRPRGMVLVDGSDAVPGSEFAVSRRTALHWYIESHNTEVSTTPPR
jgi:hypothetical protein